MRRLVTVMLLTPPLDLATLLSVFGVWEIQERNVGKVLTILRNQTYETETCRSKRVSSRKNTTWDWQSSSKDGECYMSRKSSALKRWRNMQQSNTYVSDVSPTPRRLKIKNRVSPATMAYIIQEQYCECKHFLHLQVKVLCRHFCHWIT